MYTKQEGINIEYTTSMLDHIPVFITQWENFKLVKEIEEYEILNVV
jgi:hypothetical protein